MEPLTIFVKKNNSLKSGDKIPNYRRVSFITNEDNTSMPNFHYKQIQVYKSQADTKALRKY